MIADISPAKDKAKNFGYMSAIINSGFILGPGIGGFLAEFSHRASGSSEWNPSVVSLRGL
jgi:DHA1 family quinolone resistance protein-like MFS transporter